MTRRFVAACLLFFVIGVGLPLSTSPHIAVGQAPMQTLSVLQSTTEHLVVAFTLPDYVLTETVSEGRTFLQVQVPGFDQSEEPGRPQLPRTGTLIGLPPTGVAAVRILASESTVVPLNHPVYPAPRPVPVPISDQVDGTPPSPAYQFVLDRVTYSRDAFYPSSIAEIVDLGTMRGLRLARLAFHPLRYNPVRGELEVTRRLLVEIDYGSSGDAVHLPSASARVASPAFDRVLAEALLNDEVARAWRSSPSPQMGIAALNLPATQPGSLKVVVPASGLYRLTYADLQSLLPVDTLAPTTFQLFEQGQEVAILVTGEGDGSFDPGDAILFYGHVPKSRYTNHNTYWLRYGDGPGLRMASRDVAPEGEPAGTAWVTARHELNAYYVSTHPAADGDHWYAAQIRSEPPTDYTATLSLMPPDTGVPTATLRVGMVGFTPNHHTRATVNGHVVGDSSWGGEAPYTATFTIDRAFLGAGNSTVQVSALAAQQVTWVDAIEISYPLQSVTGDEVLITGEAGSHLYELDGFSSTPQLYDVSDPCQPVRLLGVVGGGGTPVSFADTPAQPSTYLALTPPRMRQPASIVVDTPSDLHTGPHGADYVMIAHGDLLGAVAPLADLHRGQGLRVTVVDVQDIYDEFSGGLLSPEAIREFIAHAYANWAPPALTYALLVGDGTYDFLDHFGYGAQTHIPPYLAMVDPWWGETAADNRFADVTQDGLADVLLGRLPVSTAGETNTAVAKILSYGQNPLPGDWNTKHVFVADSHDGPLDFATMADGVHDVYVNPPWTGTKVYLDELPPAEAQSRTQFAWQRGALFMSFVGHSSWHQWSADNLFDYYDVPGLTNDRRWPVVLSMTCFTGFFHHPEYDTLDEALLSHEGGGAVATWSPSGLGVATGHDALHHGFYDTVSSGVDSRLGPATAAAKLRLLSESPADVDLVDTYHLFGDPAMEINLTIRSWPHSLYLPLVAKN